MKIWYNNILDSKRYVAEVLGDCIRIGRGSRNDIVLNNPHVPDEAAVLHRRSEAWEITALGLGGCRVGDREIRGGEVVPIRGGEVLSIFPYTLNLEIEELGTSLDGETRERERHIAELVQSLHLDLLRRLDISGSTDTQGDNDNYVLQIEHTIDEMVRVSKCLTGDHVGVGRHISGLTVQMLLLESLTEGSRVSQGIWVHKGAWRRLMTLVPERERELTGIVRRLRRKLGVDTPGDIAAAVQRVENEFWAIWESEVLDLFNDFTEYLALRYLKKQIKDIVFGYGPLEDLLTTPSISEIMVVDKDRIFVERNGVVENSGRRFISDEVTQAVIERIVSKVGRRIDKSQPLVDARLTDGSRVNAIIPPLAVAGPCLTIRKFPLQRLLIDDLVARGALSRSVVEFLRASVISRKNVLISGGTGTGKTTLLNCLSDFIPDNERIVTIEDTAELQIKKEHVVTLETKQANVEGAGEYTIRDLVKNALRMRPDRVVVGECRGPEALDMLQAMNTGHDGSLTTIHANSSEDVILRLEVLVQMASDLPLSSIHRQIAAAIHLIVQMTRFGNGARKVTQVTEITGIDESSGEILTRDIFSLNRQDPLAILRPTGRLPTFMGELIEKKLIHMEDFYGD